MRRTASTERRTSAHGRPRAAVRRRPGRVREARERGRRPWIGRRSLVDDRRRAAPGRRPSHCSARQRAVTRVADERAAGRRRRRDPARRADRARRRAVSSRARCALGAPRPLDDTRPGVARSSPLRLWRSPSGLPVRATPPARVSRRRGAELRHRDADEDDRGTRDPRRAEPLAVDAARDAGEHRLGQEDQRGARRRDAPLAPQLQRQRDRRARDAR